MTLELSSIEDVAHFLGIDTDGADYGEDYGDLAEALAVGREQITKMVKPADELPDPLPASLHRACTMRSAEIFADRPERYGYQAAVDDGEGGPPPAKYLIRDLISPWKRVAAGTGPDPAEQSW